MIAGSTTPTISEHHQPRTSRGRFCDRRSIRSSTQRTRGANPRARPASAEPGHFRRRWRASHQYQIGCSCRTACAARLGGLQRFERIVRVDAHSDRAHRENSEVCSCSLSAAGPTVRATTSPVAVSRMRNASSTANSSNGFTSYCTWSRTSRPSGVNRIFVSRIEAYALSRQ